MFVLVTREDMYAQDSIELLTTSGIQFKKHEDEGIETLYFAELLMTSGVVLCDGVKWLSFHRYFVQLVAIFACSPVYLSVDSDTNHVCFDRSVQKDITNCLSRLYNISCSFFNLCLSIS